MTTRHRVLQLGNVGVDGGGIAAVLHEWSQWGWPRSDHEFVDTYVTDPRMFGLRRLLAAAAILIRRRRRVEVAHVHVSQGGSFVREGALVLLARVVGVRCVVVTVHGSDFDEFAGRHRRLVTAVLRRADAVTVLSQTTCDVVSTLGCSHVHVVPNGVAARAEGSPPVPFADRTDSVVFAGELSLRKGVDLLLRVWPEVAARHPELGLDLYGPPRDADVTTVPASVTVHGVRPRDEVRTAMAHARLLVLPSRAESFGMATLEAMAEGTPVVATRVGGAGELVGDAAQLIDPGDPDQLREAMLGLLADTETGERAGVANRNRYLERYAPAVVAAQLENLYESGRRRG